MGDEKEYISVGFLDFSCFHTYVFIFRGKKRESKYKRSFFSYDGETERERRRKFGEGKTFLDIQTYTFNKSVHLTFKKT